VFDDDDESHPSLPPPAPEERPMTIPMGVLWAVLASAGMLLILSVTQALRPGAVTDLVNIQGCMAVAFLTAIFLMGRVHANLHTLPDFLGIRHTHPLLHVIAAPLGVALTIPAEILHRAIERKWPTPPDQVLEQLAAFRMDSQLRRIVIPLVVIAIGPLVEELFFRGALFRGLRRVHPDSVVVPVIALLFSAAHIDTRAMLPLFVLGLFLGLLRTGSGSLLPALIAHMAFNAVGIFELLRAQPNPETDTAPLPAAWSAGGLAATLVLTALFVYVARRSSRAQLAREEDSK
jgi:uncharacterized protein